MAKSKKKTKPAENGGAGAKRPNINISKKALVEVKKEIRHARRPLYDLNRKIKEAPTKYQERKLKKQRRDYLAGVEPRLQELVEKRSELNTKIKVYQGAVTERSSAKRRLKSIEKKIAAAEENLDWKEVERLSYLVVKERQKIDKLSEAAGIELKKTDLSKFDREELEDEGGEGYQLDQRSPYSIWEGIKQLHKDLDSGSFKFFVINGKRISGENAIQITAEASVFWISIKKRRDGTPYINRYINFKSKSVKYKYFNS
jgi:hypothetical protein